jgi:hypothetical protein
MDTCLTLRSLRREVDLPALTSHLWTCLERRCGHHIGCGCERSLRIAIGQSAHVTFRALRVCQNLNATSMPAAQPWTSLPQR